MIQREILLGNQKRSGIRLIRLYSVYYIFLYLLFSASLVHADRGPYGRYVSEGIKEYDRGNYVEARALFKKAHELNSNARTLRGMGMCAFELREYVEAIQLLKASLTNEDRPLIGKLKDQVEELIQRSLDFVAHYQVELGPEGSELFIDGNPANLQTGELLLDPGRYKIVVRAKGYHELSRVLHVKGGERSALKLVLHPIQVKIETVAGAKPKEESGSNAYAQVSEGDSDPMRLWTWAAAGGAVAFAGAAGIFWLLADSEYSEIENRCATEGCPERRALDRIVDDTNFKEYKTMTLISLVASGVFASTACVLYVVGSSSEQKDVSLTVQYLGTGTQIRGRF